MGNLHPTRDFVDVPTQARAIVDATLAVQGIETVNIGSGHAIRVADMIDRILSEIGRNIKVIFDPMKGRASERSNLCGTTNRLKSLIGCTPDQVTRETIRAIPAEANQQVVAIGATVGSQDRLTTKVTSVFAASSVVQNHGAR
jgi:UDP-glucose 4-epimerase